MTEKEPSTSQRSKGSMSTLHQERPVKVTAWVDEAIAPLVVALNEYADVMTLDSCQGGNGIPAYVLFCYRRPHDAGAVFAHELATVLSEGASDLGYTLSAEWRLGAEEPLLRLSCPPDTVERVAELLSACRRTACPRGIPRTALRN